MPEFENLIYEKKGKIAYVTINRPHVLNAIDGPTQMELNEAFWDFRDDPDLWVAILTGAGERAFCAGADIKWMAAHLEERQKNWQRRELFGHLFQRGGNGLPIEIWKPMIAAVNGYCLGGGLECALCCDIIIASENASFGLPEITHGWMAFTGSLKLPRRIPLHIAMEIILTGDRISAERAERIGLVNKVVPQSQLMAEATKMAERIMENPPLGVRAAKEVVYRALDMPLDYPPLAWHLRIDSPTLAYRQSRDVREGEQAFVEKRRPQFQGR